MSMIEAGGQGSIVIQEKANKFNVLPEKVSFNINLSNITVIVQLLNILLK